MYPQTSIFDRIKLFFGSRSSLSELILINVAIWLLIRFFGVFAFLFSSPGSPSAFIINSLATKWLAIPALPELLLARPWTLFTYMFLHLEFFHILFNMLWLFWFGQIFLQYLSSRQLVFTYLTGGIAGGIIFMLFYNVFPVYESVLPMSMAMGASASVLAIVVAIAFHMPNFTIYLLLIGPVKIKYVAIFTVFIDFLMIMSDNSGGHIAHLGGALWGFIFARALAIGVDMSQPFKSLSFKGFSGIFRKKKKTPFTYIYTNDKPLTDEEYNYKKVENQKRIDIILDKIKLSGYDSLTREEKEFLFSNSRK